jgi:predicted nucleic acid-binding protein
VRLVLDATCLIHFARADRLDVLGELLLGCEAATTEVVREEVRAGEGRHPGTAAILDLEWLRVTRLDTPAALVRFTDWVRRIGAGERHLGEASVLAVAEESGATAVIDERAATHVGRAAGVDVHGTIWLLAGACRDGKLTEVGAGNLVDALAGTRMYLPCSGTQFAGWTRGHGLL